MLCEPITSANTARDFFGYVFLKIRANERRGFLSAFGGYPVAVMCLDKSFQSVESHLPESVFAIHKYCVRKLLTLWNGHEGEIQLTETRYSTVVARGLYRLRFAKPTQPFPSIDPYFRQFDEVTSLATCKMSDFRQAVDKVSKVWEPSELAGVYVERNQDNLELLRREISKEGQRLKYLPSLLVVRCLTSTLTSSWS